MITKRKPRGYWNKEKCHKLALTCETKDEFRIKYPDANSASRRLGCYDEITSHMIPGRKPIGYWEDKERCRKAALDCNTKGEFRSKYSAAYENARENGWLDDICSHMEEKQKPRGYWNDKENCRKAALDCNTRGEFQKRYGRACQVARKNGWLDEICSHMIKPLSGKYIIYGYFFEDGYFYVGLSINRIKRKNDHKNKINSPVFKHSKKTKTIPRYEELFEQIIYSELEIQIMEDYYINVYLDKGLKKLNTLPAGGLGGKKVKITKEECHQVALQCTTKTEFRKSYPKEYRISLEKKWSVDICSHMVKPPNPNKIWVKEKCRQAALKCKTKTEFQKKYPGAHKSAWQNKWLDEICSHMSYPHYSKWHNKEYCKKFALKCKYRTVFYKKHQYGYNISRENNWLDEFFPKI